MSRVVVTACALLAACAAATRSGTSKPFDGEIPLRMTMRGSSYAGTATLKQVGDSVSGVFSITGPGTVKGTMRGRVTKSVAALELTYAVAENGCKGIIQMNGTVANAAVAEGAVEAQDSCVGRMTGTLRMGK